MFENIYLYFFKASIIFISLGLRSFSCALVVLGYPGLGVESVIVPLLLLIDCILFATFSHLGGFGPFVVGIGKGVNLHVIGAGIGFYGSGFEGLCD